MKEFDHIVTTIAIFVCDVVILCSIVFGVVVGSLALVAGFFKLGKEGREAAGWTDPKFPR